MRIYKDNVVRSKVFRGFRRTRKPTTIVIHGTAGGGTLNWWRNGHKTASGKRHLRGVGLTHFLILTNGRVIEIYDPAKHWVYHSSTGTNDALNIGVELENKSPRNLNGYTNAQYKSLATLIRILKKRFGNLSLSTHKGEMKKFKKKHPKNCPGKQFSFVRLYAHLYKTQVIFTAGLVFAVALKTSKENKSIV